MGIFSVLVDAPAHSGLTEALDYTSEHALKPGMLVRVPLGRREVLGVVWDRASDGAQLEAHALKSVLGVCEGLPALNDSWRQLVHFAAQYYQRSPGEMALQALPPQWKSMRSEEHTSELQSH